MTSHRPSLAVLMVGLVLSALFAVGCAQDESEQAGATTPAVGVAAEDPTSTSDTGPVQNSGEAADSSVEAPIDQVSELMASMTIEAKVGQLLMPAVEGTGASAVDDGSEATNLATTGYSTPAEIVAAYHLGGLIYMPGNIESAEQVRALSSDLQAVGRESDGAGLLIAVDQEGGQVNRITDQVTVFPAAEDLTGDAGAVRAAGYITGQQLQRQGFNVVLAPVADVTDGTNRGFIGDRAYGDDPQVVADMVAAAVTGLQDAGVAAAAKHWPGHGATATDSHQDLPRLDIDRAGWDKRERIPFQAAIDDDVAIVLVGHLALPGIDPSGDPATVSPVLIDQLLRRDLGYDGVVMTDALNMGAVAAYGPGELAVRSLEAGADIMLMPSDLSDAYTALLEAVDSGRIAEDQLDAAVERVLRLKQKLGLLEG